VERTEMLSAANASAGHSQAFVDFTKRISRLHEVVTSVKRYYAVWLELYEFKSKQAQLWERYLGFFATVQLALSRMVLMELAKAFDEDSRSAGLPALIGRAMQNRAELTPRWSDEELKHCRGEVSKCAGEVNKKLRDVRNKELAHPDVDPPTSRDFQRKELDGWIAVLENALDEISQAHDGRSFMYQDIVNRTGSHTRSLLQTLARGTPVEGAAQGETHE